ncbi:HalOD1 output domain-containing protein [Haloterrigena turkmenica]|uniref:HalOD1 output domain-containing protein n=1 Tax=Haloterrigena turkmenica TaxID=62320 RepID=UPI0011D03D54|nr:HalOD1 output domain-containing protein [Haloterrigena turkmenica]
METNDQRASLIPDGGRVFQTEYHNEPPVRAVVRALSILENRSIEHVPPFYEYADSDALNQLMETARDSDQEISVEVTVEEYNISVESDGTIVVSDPTADSELSE